jgi:hypothetical protein
MNEFVQEFDYILDIELESGKRVKSVLQFTLNSSPINKNETKNLLEKFDSKF